MTKAAIIISAILVFAGVAAASSMTGLTGKDNPSVDPTVPVAQTTTATTTSDDDIRREDRADEQEDVSGPCDEAEHANDPRCTGAAAPQTGAEDNADDDDRGNDDANDPRCTGAAAPQTGAEDNADDDDRGNDDHGANRGPGNGGGEDDNSGHQSGNSGPGGGGDDD